MQSTASHALMPGISIESKRNTPDSFTIARVNVFGVARMDLSGSRLASGVRAGHDRPTPFLLTVKER